MNDKDLIDAAFGTQSTAAPLPPPMSDEELVNSAFSSTPQVTYAPRGTTPSQWGFGSNFADALTFGLGKRGLAFSPTPEEARTGVMSDYSTRLARLNALQKQYEASSPTGALLSEIGGGVVGATGAMALGQDYAIAPIAERLAMAAPRIVPALNFLGGSAGGFGGVGVRGLSNAGLRVASQATRGAVEGGVAGALQSDQGQGSIISQAGEGALAGGLIGPASSLLGLGSHIDPDVARAVSSAIRQGVPIRAGMVPGAAKPVVTLDQLTNMNNNPTVQRGFDRALSSWANLPEDKINSSWVERAKSLNGSTMGRIAAKYSVDASDPAIGGKLNAGLAALDQQAKLGLSNEDYAKFHSALYDPVQQNLANGPLAGSIYQRWTGKGGLLETAAKNPGLRPYVSGSADDPNLPLVGMREILDNAWHDTIAKGDNPQDYADFGNAKQGYKIAKMIEPGASDSANYNPQKLEAAIRKRYGSTANAGALGDLGTAGQFIYKPEASPAKSNSILATAGAHPYTTGTLGGAVGTAGTLVGEHLLEHVPMAHELGSTALSNPGLSTLAAASLGATALGTGKIAGKVTGSPLYTQHLLDIAQGKARPWLGGVNPLTVLGANLENKRGEANTR